MFLLLLLCATMTPRDSRIKDRNRGRLETHPYAHQDTADEQLVPVLGTRRADGGEEAEDGGNKDGATAPEDSVHGVVEPAADKGRANVWRGIDHAHEPRANSRPYRCCVWEDRFMN